MRFLLVLLCAAALAMLIVAIRKLWESSREYKVIRTPLGKIVFRKKVDRKRY